ncbi:JAB domain-containing protein [Cetobacterium sp.]|uniref:JAB domain-containing protein n=1 Tax=Cetobacterium sp. TaxID=2071632 RepID=UPI003F3F7585
MKEILEFLGVSSIAGLKRAINKNEPLAKEFLEVTKLLLKEDIKKENLEIRGKEKLMSYLKSDLGFLKHEEFKVIFLSSDNKIIYEEVLFKGTIDRSVVYPRLVIEKAIMNNAKGVIFAHNHPSGNLKPSKKDIEITLEMQEILEKVDVKLLDHIIVSDCDEFSFYQNGLIEYY